MRFLMLVLTDPELTTPDEGPITIEEWVDEAYGTQRAVEGDRLRPPEEALSIRRRDGEVSVVDGPVDPGFLLLGGFDVLECETLDEAIELASRHPMASAGVIQLHPSWSLDL